MNKVYIMQGLPGSGKSTAVAKLTENADEFVICSADNFHMVDGKYDYKPENAHIAHLQCKNLFFKSLQNKIPVIIVDNTNLDCSTINGYVGPALTNEYEVVIIRSNTSWARNIDELTQRNVHAVPREVIQKMSDKLDIFDKAVKTHPILKDIEIRNI